MWIDLYLTLQRFQSVVAVIHSEFSCKFVCEKYMLIEVWILFVI